MRTAAAFVLVFLGLLSLLIFAAGQRNGTLGESGPLVPGRHAATEAARLHANTPMTPAAYTTPTTVTIHPQATLVKVSSGEVIPLWVDGGIVLHPSFAPDNARLYYSLAEPADSSSQILSVELRDGAAPRPLTAGTRPLPSPDGEFVAFLQNDPDAQANRLQVLDSRGEEATVLRDRFLQLLGWSPDSQWLLATTYKQLPVEEFTIWLIHSGDWQAFSLDKFLACGCDGRPTPQWSSDSKFLLFEDVDSRTPPDGGYDLVAIPGGEPRRVSNSFATWSGDGRFLLIEGKTSAADQSRYSVFESDTAGNRRLLLAGLTHPTAPLLSPNGTAFAILTFGTGQTKTSVYRVDGSQQKLFEVSGTFRAWANDGRHLLTQTTECDNGAGLFDAKDGRQIACLANAGPHGLAASFSPDGKKLAYLRSTSIGGGSSREPASSNDLYVREIESGVETLLVSGMLGALSCVTWSPDGNWIVTSAGCAGP